LVWQVPGPNATRQDMCHACCYFELQRPLLQCIFAKHVGRLACSCRFPFAVALLTAPPLATALPAGAQGRAQGWTERAREASGQQRCAITSYKYISVSLCPCCTLPPPAGCGPMMLYSQFA
jgi:hypothetical protein